MAREQQPTDYFFIIQSDRPTGLGDGSIYPDKDIFAKGRGLEVVESLARTALMHVAQSADAFRLGRGLDEHDTVLPLMRALPGYERFPGDADGSRVDVNPFVLAKLFDWKHLRSMREKHHEAVYNQVRDGYRSPASALEEFTTESNDLHKIFANSHEWFDNEGRRILPPDKRKGDNPDDKDRAQLNLKTVTRGSATYRIEKETKQALFEQVPEKAKAFSVDVIPLRNERGWINPRKLFYGGKMLVHKTFGYIPRGSEEFVPVVTELSPEHPARQVK
jgi:hypothetical protein